MAIPSACSFSPNVDVPVVSGAADSTPTRVSSGIFDSCSMGIDWRIILNPSSRALPSNDIASDGAVGPSGGSSMIAPVNRSAWRWANAAVVAPPSE